MEQIDSLYAAYKLEFENVFTVFLKDIGFSNFKLEEEFENDISIYVQEVYVVPSKRGNKNAALLTDMAIKKAEQIYKKKVSKIYTTIGIGGATVDLSIRSITNYGFKILTANEKMIYFFKEI